MVTDLKMPGISGLDVLGQLMKLAPETDVVIMTAFGTVETAVQAMRCGAYDYIAKPFASDELIVLLQPTDRRTAIAKRQCGASLGGSRRQARHRPFHCRITGNGPE